MRKCAIAPLYLIAFSIASCSPAMEPISRSPEASRPVILTMVIGVTTSPVLSPTIVETQAASTATLAPEISPQPVPSPTEKPVYASRVVWRGQMPATLMSALLADWPADRAAATIHRNSTMVFGMDMWVGIVAAYVYSDQGTNRIRALFLVPGGGLDDRPGVPFLAKIDLALNQIAGHESFGSLGEITRALETEYRQVAVAHFLQIALLTEAAPDDEEFRAERQRLGIELPIDIQHAQEIVLVQWQRAKEVSQAAFSTTDAIVEYVEGLDESWWDDARVSRFDVPPVRVCVGADPYNCATYSSVQLSVDALAVPEGHPGGPTPTSRMAASQPPAVETAVNAEIMTLVARETVPARGLIRSEDQSDGSAAVYRFLHLLSVGQYSEAVSLYGGSYQDLWALSCCAVDPHDHAAIWRDVCERMVLRCLEPYGVEWRTVSSHESFEYYAYFQEADGSVMGAPPNGTPVSFSVISSGGRLLVVGLPPGGK